MYDVKKTYIEWIEIFFKDLYTSGQKAHEKILSISNDQRNTSQSYSEVSPHIGQKCHHQKVYKQ